jgi:uncharacterized protein (UPF0332 family)
VKAETQAHLDKSTQCLRKARAELAAAATEPALTEDAARNAYYAAFHAAKALIFERTGKNHKSHAGVHTEFHRLVQDEPAIGRRLRAFLKKSYGFKASADYDVDTEVQVTPERAGDAIADATRFVDGVRALLGR